MLLLDLRVTDCGLKVSLRFVVPEILFDLGNGSLSLLSQDEIDFCSSIKKLKEIFSTVENKLRKELHN
jgi:hypothetical protein